MNRARWISVGVVLLVRLFFAGELDLAEDEAYYWVWSQTLQWGYFDHPPMIAYWIALGSAVLGKTELGVRAFGIVISSVALLAPGFRSPQPLLCFLLLCTLPLFSLGGILATPDLPLLSFWCLALWAAFEKRWYWYGLFAGGALLSKYTAFLLLPCVLAVCWRDRKCWMATGIALLLYAPNIWWNIQHDWVSWQFQLFHIQDEPRRLDFILAQAALISPVLLFAIPFWLPFFPKERVLRLCYVTTVIPFAVAVWVGGEANWGAPAYVGLAAGLARMDGRWKQGAWTAVGLNGALSILIFIHLLRPLIDLPTDPSHRLNGGRNLADAVKAWGMEHVWTERYQEAAWIHFYGDLPAHTNKNFGRMSQYDLWATDLPETGLYVRPYRSKPPQYLPLMGYTLHTPRRITAHVDTTDETAFIRTHIWQSYVFSK
ncbi:MAG: glycosyltransferase family 39 protein [Myxococcota bacterium]|nr:glycosyltransferase family 39 protein [Myxococcota bacterium]